MQKLLTTNNAKIAKSVSYGYLTFGLHLAPALLSGREVCPWRSAGCTASCLNTAGQGIFSNVQAARIAKTQFFFRDRAGFLAQLWKEINAAVVKAAKQKLTPVFRLNLTSDIPWEVIRHNGQTIFESFPRVQFMDYTKGIERFAKFRRGELPKNYHLTFSKSETNGADVDRAIALGGNVAIVFADSLPEFYLGLRVVNGDTNDLRFLDPSGVIVGLTAKGKAKKDSTGFAVETHLQKGAHD